MLSQYRGRVILEAWGASYLLEVQALEDAAYGVLLSRYVDRATGAALDVLGRLVGETRLGRTDDAFRLFIYARIRINRSRGRLQDLYDVCATVTSARVLVWDEPYAKVGVELFSAPGFAPSYLLTMLRQAKAGGIGLTLTVATAPMARALVASTVADGSPVVANGAGTVNDPNVGGLAATYLR